MYNYIELGRQIIQSVEDYVTPDSTKAALLNVGLDAKHHPRSSEIAELLREINNRQFKRLCEETGIA